MKKEKIITGEKQTPVKDEKLEELLKKQRDTGNDKEVNEYLASKSK